MNIATGPWKSFDACQRRAQQVERNAASNPHVVATWPPHMDETHIALHLEGGNALQPHRIEMTAVQIAYVLKYLNKIGLDVQGVQVEAHGLGEMLMQFLRRNGVTAQPLPTLCKPSACNHHPAETGASPVAPRPDGCLCQGLGPSPLAPR